MSSVVTDAFRSEGFFICGKWAAGGCGGCCFPVAEKESIRRLAGYQLPVEIFKYLTIQAVDCCLV
ncbi:hypothetical protein DM382_23460, partial [Escherichia coli]|nr:hypothetical protein [Escherichia coli]